MIFSFQNMNPSAVQIHLNKLKEFGIIK